MELSEGKSTIKEQSGTGKFGAGSYQPDTTKELTHNRNPSNLEVPHQLPQLSPVRQSSSPGEYCSVHSLHTESVSSVKSNHKQKRSNADQYEAGDIDMDTRFTVPAPVLSHTASRNSVTSDT